jgi:hypothetical protein
MAHYLVKTYDVRGHVVDRFEFAAPSDAEAEGAVGDLPDKRTHELWCGKRWVRTCPPPSSTT